MIDRRKLARIGVLNIGSNGGNVMKDMVKIRWLLVRFVQYLWSPHSTNTLNVSQFRYPFGCFGLLPLYLPFPLGGSIRNAARSSNMPALDKNTLKLEIQF